jgi:hypothetical protein
MIAGADSPRGHVFFSGDDRLEGILEWPDTVGTVGRVVGGVVVAHPHPLYGGTMAQPVVYRVAQACRQQGLVSLRFNFRGVGQSQGKYDGIEEYRDIEAAAAFLRGRLAANPGVTEPGGRRLPLGLAGYSFGSVMVARAAAGPVPVRALALIAPVVTWAELPPDTLDRLSAFRGPVLAVCGELDDLASPGEVESVLRVLKIDFRIAVVDGAGHLFEQRQREVGELVASFLAERLVGRPRASGA